MNSDTILQSDLLDIIFENRNKEYGAYLLRKNYPNCLMFSLMLMFSVVLILFFIQFFAGNPGLVVKTESFKKPHEYRTSNFVAAKNAGPKTAVPVLKRQKVIGGNSSTAPRIIDDRHINKMIASESSHSSSDIMMPGNEGLKEGNDAGVNADFSDTQSSLMVTEKKKIQEKMVLPVAEIMPQFSGGLKALLSYLKKNLQAPDNAIEDGKVITVKVKFVVNYSSKLMSFTVIESGGEVFDNEVVRVLKKMPLWIPGRSNGENVSVYYIIPVKFTNEY